MQELKVTMNDLVICPDWISFTVHYYETVEDVISFMGFQAENFRKMPNGANGYKRMLKYEDISILYDGSEDMGIHVNITGGSIATLLDAFQKKHRLENPFGSPDDLCYDLAFTRFCEEVLSIGQFSRIDIAIDDLGTNYYSTDDIVEKINCGLIISKWRTSLNNVEKVLSNNDKVGHTVYFGSTQSDIRMRIYDKQLELNKGLSTDDEKYLHDKRTRWELQLRKDRANNLAFQLANGMSIGEVAIGVLSNYFRIIQLDNNHKSRCSSEKKWDSFICNVSKLKITSKKEQKTLEEEIKQWEHQNGRKVSKILYAVGGQTDYFTELAQRYECKLTPQDREQLGV